MLIIYTYSSVSATAVCACVFMHVIKTVDPPQTELVSVLHHSYFITLHILITDISHTLFPPASGALSVCSHRLALSFFAGVGS